MGGRGSMSMGSRTEANALAKLSDAQLGYDIWNAQDEVESIGNEMVVLSYRIDDAKASPREGRQERVDAAQEAFYEAQDRYNAARDRLNELVAEAESRRNRDLRDQAASARRFVNSYGEATTRNITSQSYESAQRRLNRQVDTWMRW